MIKLYHAPMTRSVRIVWLLEELGLDYELVKLGFMTGDLQKPEYLAKSPLGKVPAIEDGEVRMFESGAITEYLLEKYGAGRLAPAPGTPARAEFLQWLHFAEATAMPPLVDILANTFIKPEAQRIPQVAEEAKPRVARILALLDRQLAGREFLLGDEFSAADIMMGFTVGGAQLVGLLDERYPNLQAYMARLSERPAFKKAGAA